MSKLSYTPSSRSGSKSSASTGPVATTPSFGKTGSGASTTPAGMTVAVGAELFAEASRFSLKGMDLTPEDSEVLERTLLPWSPEKERLATQDLPEAERAAEAQLMTCRALGQVARSVAEVLSGAGVGVQREVASVLVGGMSVEARLLGEDPIVAEAGSGLLAACRSLGESLVGLASILTGSVLTPLEEMQRGLESKHEKEKAGLMHLEHMETVCANALLESAHRKERATGELQDKVKEKDLKKGKAKPSLMKMLKPAFSKAESKIQHAAHAQSAAVEEMASRLDQAATAREQRDAGVQSFMATLRQVKDIRARLLESALDRCAGAWEEAGQDMCGVAEKLRLGAEGLQTCVSPEERALAAREARSRVPRLRLSQVKSFVDASGGGGDGAAAASAATGPLAAGEGPSSRGSSFRSSATSAVTASSAARGDVDGGSCPTASPSGRTASPGCRTASPGSLAVGGRRRVAAAPGPGGEASDGDGLFNRGVSGEDEPSLAPSSVRASSEAGSARDAGSGPPTARGRLKALPSGAASAAVSVASVAASAARKLAPAPGPWRRSAVPGEGRSGSASPSLCHAPSPAAEAEVFAPPPRSASLSALRGECQVAAAASAETAEATAAGATATAGTGESRGGSFGGEVGLDASSELPLSPSDAPARNPFDETDDANQEERGDQEILQRRAEVVAVDEAGSPDEALMLERRDEIAQIVHSGHEEDAHEHDEVTEETGIVAAAKDIDERLDEASLSSMKVDDSKDAMMVSSFPISPDKLVDETSPHASTVSPPLTKMTSPETDVDLAPFESEHLGEPVADQQRTLDSAKDVVEANPFSPCTLEKSGTDSLVVEGSQKVSAASGLPFLAGESTASPEALFVGEVDEEKGGVLADAISSDLPGIGAPALESSVGAEGSTGRTFGHETHCTGEGDQSDIIEACEGIDCLGDIQATSVPAMSSKLGADADAHTIYADSTIMAHDVGIAALDHEVPVRVATSFIEAAPRDDAVSSGHVADLGEEVREAREGERGCCEAVGLKAGEEIIDGGVETLLDIGVSECDGEDGDAFGDRMAASGEKVDIELSDPARIQSNAMGTVLAGGQGQSLEMNHVVAPLESSLEEPNEGSADTEIQDTTERHEEDGAIEDDALAEVEEVTAECPQRPVGRIVDGDAAIGEGATNCSAVGVDGTSASVAAPIVMAVDHGVADADAAVACPAAPATNACGNVHEVDRSRDRAGGDGSAASYAPDDHEVRDGDGEETHEATSPVAASDKALTPRSGRPSALEAATADAGACAACAKSPTLSSSGGGSGGSGGFLSEVVSPSSGAPSH